MEEESMEEESKLSAVNKETYDSIFLLLDTNLLGAVELFIPGLHGSLKNCKLE